MLKEGIGQFLDDVINNSIKICKGVFFRVKLEFFFEKEDQPPMNEGRSSFDKDVLEEPCKRIVCPALEKLSCLTTRPPPKKYPAA